VVLVFYLLVFTKYMCSIIPFANSQPVSSHWHVTRK
jgi:hypothetical protein